MDKVTVFETVYAGSIPAEDTKKEWNDFYPRQKSNHGSHFVYEGIPEQIQNGESRPEEEAIPAEDTKFILCNNSYIIEAYKHFMLSWVNPKIKTQNAKTKGRGLFAQSLIKKGEVVVIQAGKIVENHEIDEPPLSNFKYDCFQIEDGFYICPAELDSNKKEGIFLMNHSCDPNCGVKGQATFIAMRDIEPGEELNYDYAMTDIYHDGIGWEEMQCLCGSGNCRKSITGHDWQRKDLQEKYRGHFSHYVQKMIDLREAHN